MEYSQGEPAPPLSQLSLEPPSLAPPLLTDSETSTFAVGQGPSQYPYGLHSLESSSPGTPRHHSKRASMALRQAERLTKRAAQISKQKIWDSNDASIDAAQSAVDLWEASYNALRGLLVATAHSAKGAYGAAKAGAANLEDGLLVPVRDWLLLPAFSGVEHVAGETLGFLQSEQAVHLAQASLQLARQVPYVGGTILAPALVMGVNVAHQTWQIAQYPIPSPTAVHDSVDRVMTGTKWVLTTAGREMYFYAKRMDANITRTLMHTQWRVLGSGPYATLDPRHKREVLDHICERYFAMEDDIERYELAAHIRAHNRRLYRDLVSTGLLRERGGDLTQHDEWLALCPSYYSMGSPFLLPTGKKEPSIDAIALWFLLPYQNGKRPGREVPWVRFAGSERKKLEERYLDALSRETGRTAQSSVANQALEDVMERDMVNSPQSQEGGLDPVRSMSSDGEFDAIKRYPTVAQWYIRDRETDLLIYDKRQAVSFCNVCPQCRRIHPLEQPPLPSKQYGELCDDCTGGDDRSFERRLAIPSLEMIMRPTMWRFHGPGDEIRRAVWFLDTKRHGLQPYGMESAAILEDAYLFLRWKLGNTTPENEIEGSLLTVQVTSPDGGEKQLVQFSSLTQATAIQKGLGAAISLFKWRVYRGASTFPDNDNAAGVAASSRRFETPIPAVASGSEDWVHVDERQNQEAKSYRDPSVHPLAVKRSDLLTSDLQDESEETAVDHLVLIVHGIGEMLRNVAPFGIQLPNLSSIVDCCGYLRKNHLELHRIYPRLRPQGRVEYLPVEWHEAFAVKSQRQAPPDVSGNTLLRRRRTSSNPTVNDISLKTIPQMRAFANDTLMDVLFFMSPEHHDLMIDIVTNELNIVVQNFRSLTGFQGTISIIGHSLGSVISWDILSHQHAKEGVSDEPDSPLSDATSCSPMYTAFPERHVSSTTSSTESGELAPPLLTSAYPQLQFEVENAFMLGSPIAVFLLIRHQRDPLSEGFSLSGCPRVFNIFHPYDPVAYRIEPLIDSRNAEVEPRIITRWNGGFRVQYQTKRLWNRLMDTGLRTQQTVIDAVEDRLFRLGLLDYALDSPEHDNAHVSDSGYSSESSDAHRVICGCLNEGGRVDFMLQEKELENANEYVAALAAHSSYWTEKDLCLFVAQQILHSKIEASIADTIQNTQVAAPADAPLYSEPIVL